MLTASDSWAKTMLIGSLNRQLQDEVVKLSNPLSRELLSPITADLLRRSYRQSSELVATLSALNKSLSI